MKQVKILYFFPQGSSFIKKDIEIFSKHYQCIAKDFKFSAKGMIPFLLFGQFVFLIRHIYSSSVVVCRFAGYHSLLPVLFSAVFKKPSLIIVGGTEAHYFPSIGYGNKNKLFYKLATKWSLMACSRIAPVHGSLARSDYKYLPDAPQKQGFLNLFPQIKTPVTVIPNGYDPKKFVNLNVLRKPNSFLTVAISIEGKMAELKGIDMILEIAPKMPQCTFSIIAKKTNNQFGLLPENVNFLEPVSNESLSRIYNEHEFYLQLSLAEGFPNSLCEAMLCGCVPVGSGVFSIPEIIGDSGFVLMKKDISILEKIIRSALGSDKKLLGEKARERIKNNYSLEQREKLLVQTVAELVKM